MSTYLSHLPSWNDTICFGNMSCSCHTHKGCKSKTGKQESQAFPPPTISPCMSTAFLNYYLPGLFQIFELLGEKLQSKIKGNSMSNSLFLLENTPTLAWQRWETPGLLVLCSFVLKLLCYLISIWNNYCRGFKYERSKISDVINQYLMHPFKSSWTLCPLNVHTAAKLFFSSRLLPSNLLSLTNAGWFISGLFENSSDPKGFLCRDITH